MQMEHGGGWLPVPSPRTDVSDPAFQNGRLTTLPVEPFAGLQLRRSRRMVVPEVDCMAEHGKCRACSVGPAERMEEELMTMAVELFARAEARIRPRPAMTEGIEGSLAAAEWRVDLFEEMASLVAGAVG